MGTNYKAEILYNSLTSFLKQTSKDIISYPIAQAYFFAIDNTYNILEPSIRLVKDAMDYFLNSEQIINLENDGEITKHYYSDLKHLFCSKQSTISILLLQHALLNERTRLFLPMKSIFKICIGTEDICYW